MRLLDYLIPVPSRTHRVELFPFYDTHIGKRNCYESGIKKQVREILRQEAKPDRTCRVLGGGDLIEAIKPQDIRFDFDSLADWVYEGPADDIRKRLNNIADSQVDRTRALFGPIEHLFIGSLEANHEKKVRVQYNEDVHERLCRVLNMEDLTTTCKIRFRFKLKTGQVSVIKLFMRHGYGGGRTAGSEANKIAAMLADGVTHDCDICLTGHTHAFHVNPPAPILYIPNRGKLPTRQLTKYRYGANPGSWLLSYPEGGSCYEETACYPAQAMMSLKIVIWPFWSKRMGDTSYTIPKIEIRTYRII